METTLNAFPAQFPASEVQQLRLCRLRKVAIIGSCVSTPAAAAEGPNKPLAPAHKARYRPSMPPSALLRLQQAIPCAPFALHRTNASATGCAGARRQRQRRLPPAPGPATVAGRRLQITQQAPRQARLVEHTFPGTPHSRAADPAACTPHPFCSRQAGSRTPLPALRCAPDALRVLAAGSGRAEHAGGVQGGPAGGACAPGPPGNQPLEHRVPGAGAAALPLGPGRPPSPAQLPGAGIGLPPSAAASAALPPVAPNARHTKQAHAGPQGGAPRHGGLQRASPGTRSSPDTGPVAAPAPHGALPGALLHRSSPGALPRASPGRGARPPGAGSPADLGTLPRTASPPPWAGEGEGLAAGLGHGAAQGAGSARGGSGGSCASRGSADGSDSGNGFARRLASLLRPSGEPGLTRWPLCCQGR